MKNILTILGTLLCFTAAAQRPYIMVADTIDMQSGTAAGANLRIRNNTSNTKGFLYNYGQGRTVFKQACIKLNDSTYVIGADTLRIKFTGSGGSGGSSPYVRDSFSASAPLAYNQSAGVFSADTSAGATHLATQGYAGRNYVAKVDSGAAGGYYPYSTNPKGYLTTATVPVPNINSVLAAGNRGVSKELHLTNAFGDSAIIDATGLTGEGTGHGYSFWGLNAGTGFGLLANTGRSQYIQLQPDSFLFFNNSHFLNIVSPAITGSNKRQLFQNKSGTIALLPPDSVNTPINMVWMDPLGGLHVAAVPSGGGGGGTPSLGDVMTMGNVAPVDLDMNTHNVINVNGVAATAMTIGGASSSNPVSVTGSADFSGNVGVGTTSPTAKLHVIGSGLFQGAAGEDFKVLTDAEIKLAAKEYATFTGGGSDSGAHTSYINLRTDTFAAYSGYGPYASYMELTERHMVLAPIKGNPDNYLDFTSGRLYFAGRDSSSGYTSSFVFNGGGFTLGGAGGSGSGQMQALGNSMVTTYLWRYDNPAYFASSADSALLIVDDAGNTRTSPFPNKTTIIQKGIETTVNGGDTYSMAANPAAFYHILFDGNTDATAVLPDASTSEGVVISVSISLNGGIGVLTFTSDAGGAGFIENESGAYSDTYAVTALDKITWHAVSGKWYMQSHN